MSALRMLAGATASGACFSLGLPTDVPGNEFLSANAWSNNLPTIAASLPGAAWQRVRVDESSAATSAEFGNVISLRDYFQSRAASAFEEPSARPFATIAPVSAGLATPSRNADLAALWRRIEGFAQLPEDWFGEGTSLPSSQVLGAVRDILDDLPEHFRVPQATTAGDGDIGITWFKGADRFETTVSQHGYISWASKVGLEFPLGDCVDQDADGRQALYAALDQFYG